jgi:hypothetical protein
MLMYSILILGYDHIFFHMMICVLLRIVHIWFSRWNWNSLGQSIWSCSSLWSLPLSIWSFCLLLTDLWIPIPTLENRDEVQKLLNIYY